MNMNRRYIYAALIGAAIGLFALVSTSCKPVPDFPPIISRVETLRIPYWDNWKHEYDPPEKVGLEYKAVMLRFCMIFLNDGFYYFAIPVCLALLMTKWNDLKDEYSGWVCLRRALKLTGKVLLVIYIVTVGAGALQAITKPIPIQEFVIRAIILFWEGLEYSIFGFAEFVLLLAFMYHLFQMAYGKNESLVPPAKK